MRMYLSVFWEREASNQLVTLQQWVIGPPVHLIYHNRPFNYITLTEGKVGVSPACTDSTRQP